MTVADLIKEEIDIDVCDTYDERCWIAFCGPLKLTEKGNAKFADVLDTKCQHHGNVIGLLADTEREAQALKEFFYSAAGYCSTKEWDEWFEED